MKDDVLNGEHVVINATVDINNDMLSMIRPLPLSDHKLNDKPIKLVDQKIGWYAVMRRPFRRNLINKIKFNEWVIKWINGPNMLLNRFDSFLKKYHKTYSSRIVDNKIDKNIKT